MSEQIEWYYERELAFISSKRDPLARYFDNQYPAEAGARTLFAQRYPAKAGQLELDADYAIDPHVERFIQGFALLAGRIHRKLDDEFPQLTEALLHIFYPHLLMPIPAMTIAQFTADAATHPTEPVRIPKDSRMVSRPVSYPPTPCFWRSSYPVELWPIDVADATYQSIAFYPHLEMTRDNVAALRLELHTRGETRFADLAVDRLRFHLNGDRESIATLYELLFNNVQAVLVRDLDQPDRPPLELAPSECLFPVGFELDEAVIPFPVESFVGYRLLTEFFTFPNKFWFVDLGSLQSVCQAGFGKRLEVMFVLNRLEEKLARAVNKQMFQLGCTPVINLFPNTAEPITLAHDKYEYRVVPSRDYAQNGIEIYSVDEVSTFHPKQPDSRDYQPFYSFALGHNADTHNAFYHISRRRSPQEAVRVHDVYMAMVDRDFNPHVPADESVHIRTTCTNGELPHQHLLMGDVLQLAKNQAPFRGEIRILHTPTPPQRSALKTGTIWRWFSQTVMGHVSLSGSDDALDALKETLLLCAASNLDSSDKQREAVIRQLITGIARFTSRPKRTSMIREGYVGTCKGVEFTVELDRQKYVGTGVYLFASVLERFLALYASVNAFSELVVRTTQGQGILKQWPPRAANLRIP